MTLDEFEDALGCLMQRARDLPAQELLWAIEAEASALRHKVIRGDAADELRATLRVSLSPQVTANSIDSIVAGIERLIDEKIAET